MTARNAGPRNAGPGTPAAVAAKWKSAPAAGDSVATPRPREGLHSAAAEVVGFPSFPLLPAGPRRSTHAHRPEGDLHPRTRARPGDVPARVDDAAVVGACGQATPPRSRQKRQWSAARSGRLSARGAPCCASRRRRSGRPTALAVLRRQLRGGLARGRAVSRSLTTRLGDRHRRDRQSRKRPRAQPSAQRLAAWGLPSGGGGAILYGGSVVRENPRRSTPPRGDGSWSRGQP